MNEKKPTMRLNPFLEVRPIRYDEHPNFIGPKQQFYEIDPLAAMRMPWVGPVATLRMF